MELFTSRRAVSVQARSLVWQRAVACPKRKSFGQDELRGLLKSGARVRAWLLHCFSSLRLAVRTADRTAARGNNESNNGGEHQHRASKGRIDWRTPAVDGRDRTSRGRLAARHAARAARSAE